MQQLGTSYSVIVSVTSVAVSNECIGLECAFGLSWGVGLVPYSTSLRCGFLLSSVKDQVCFPGPDAFLLNALRLCSPYKIQLYVGMQQRPVLSFTFWLSSPGAAPWGEWGLSVAVTVKLWFWQPRCILSSDCHPEQPATHLHFVVLTLKTLLLDSSSDEIFHDGRLPDISWQVLRMHFDWVNPSNGVCVYYQSWKWCSLSECPGDPTRWE